MYFIYSNFPNMKEAQAAGKNLVENGLCCCVNILKSYSSIYKWKGKLAEESEYVLIAKTPDEKVAGAENALKTGHSYEVPEIVKIKLDGVNKEYEKWCGGMQ
ncbi:MAG: divalent-cation tolerance protein CutA [Candidatus ainarchaeum sp.]|nr:divalent-cation tolerance protein CutA [Candidatus ainarchaeum sp.]